MGNAKGSKHRPQELVQVEIRVQYKAEVPDPEKTALVPQLHSAGFGQVIAVEKGKYFQIKLANVTLRKARAIANQVSKILLANPVTESFKLLKIEVLIPHPDDIPF